MVPNAGRPAISKLVWSKNTEQAAHYRSKKPATRAGDFLDVRSLTDVDSGPGLALMMSLLPAPFASQAETREGVRVRRLEAENAALRMELSSLQGKLSQCKDDLSLAEEKYDRLVAGIGRLLAAD
ncbi:hypothetical protein BS47DRAFT_1367874 [Hydnum rufescens UP504]|uniref:Uncharacterized protein n=1 Tax=Hydnum rufescens UP504 TaxID=1448309 RepID=A0A9P6AIW8_9AGAM|nr:hypothetical protein BS47DRAFT_1367874 [Hydnum rufescens UP504]